MTNISYIYKHGRAPEDIEKTYAYTKIDQDKFLIVSISRNYQDTSDKLVARNFAKNKLLHVLDMLEKTGGRFKPRGKFFFKFIDFKQLKDLKQKVLFNNEILKEVKHLLAMLRKGYKNSPNFKSHF